MNRYAENDSGKIAERVRELREWNGYRTQQQFADALGLSKDKIKQRESHKVPYTVEQLIDICNLLNVDMDYLLGRQREETRESQDLQDITGLSSDACRIITETLREKNEDEEIDDFLQDKHVNVEPLREMLSWLIEHDILVILMNTATLKNAYQFFKGSNIQDMYNNLENADLRNLDTQLFLQEVVNEKLLSRMIDDYLSETESEDDNA